jgi:hypothetical protein
VAIPLPCRMQERRRDCGAARGRCSWYSPDEYSDPLLCFCYGLRSAATGASYAILRAMACRSESRTTRYKRHISDCFVVNEMNDDCVEDLQVPGADRDATSHLIILAAD